MHLRRHVLDLVIVVHFFRFNLSVVKINLDVAIADIPMVPLGQRGLEVRALDFTSALPWRS